MEKQVKHSDCKMDYLAEGQEKNQVLRIFDFNNLWFKSVAVKYALISNSLQTVFLWFVSVYLAVSVIVKTFFKTFLVQT